MGKGLQKSGLIHDDVNGKAKYYRIPIRRKRTPIYAEEMAGVLYRYMTKDGVDRERIKAEAQRLFEAEEPENAGIMLSVLDFMDLFERILFVHDGEGRQHERVD